MILDVIHDKSNMDDGDWLFYTEQCLKHGAEHGNKVHTSHEENHKGDWVLVVYTGNPPTKDELKAFDEA